jgi:hypothetical protein
MNKVKNITLQNLILIRFLASPDDGLKIIELKKSLEPFFINPPSRDELQRELQQLTDQGSLQANGKARFKVTPQGRKPALQILGLSSLPQSTRWPTLKNCYLIASVLDVPAPVNDLDRQCIASADGLRASILANAYQLSTGAYPSLTKARDNLLWQQLTDTTVTTNLKKKLSTSNARYNQPFTQGSIMTLLLNNLLDIERELPWESALKQLAAKVVGARRTTPEELRLAIFKAATEKPPSLEQQSKPESQAPMPPSTFSVESLDLEIFAAQVMQSANRCQTGRFGDNEIFISHVWRQMESDGKQLGLDLERFKHYLALANNKGLVRLSRADLAYALDQGAVSASETSYLNSIFHFINLEQ